jgi:tetratricopeptide (TPR) repeat protein
VEDVLRFGLGDANDQTHNVLLGMFANGGVLLGLAYAAVMGLVGVALVRGLLADVEQERRLLLGAVGGAWAGYVVVSLVSIDVPALATLGWVLSGGVLAVAGHTQFVRVPGRASPRGGLRPALDIGLVAVVLIATWGASLPLRADLAAGSATSLLANGRQAQGLEAAARATQLAPWRPVYWFELGRGLAVSGRFDQAQQAFQTAAAKDPRDLPAALTSARLAVRLGDADTARDEYERALALEPQHPALKVEVAEFASQVGAQEWARELLAEALAVDPDNEQARQLRDSLAS